MNDKPLTKDEYETLQENREVKQDNTKLKFLVDELQKENLGLSEEKKALKNANSDLQSKHEVAVKENEAIKLENGGLIETVKSETEKQKSLQQENDTLKSENQKLRKDYFRNKMEASSELKDAQEYVSEIENTCEDLEQQIAKLKRSQLSESELEFFYLCKADVSLSKLNKEICTHRELMEVGFPTRILRDKNIEGVQTSNFLLQRNGENKYKITKL